MTAPDSEPNTPSPPSVVAGRPPWRSVIALLAVAVVTLLVTMFGVSLWVDEIPPLTEATLAAAQVRWEQNGPASYDMDLELRGARPGTVHVEVRDGQVVAMQRDGETPSQRRTWDVWTVPGQFETIERELVLAVDPVHEMQASENAQLDLRCEFDPEFGYPRVFHRIVYGGGPEVYWRVSRFTPL